MVMQSPYGVVLWAVPRFRRTSSYDILPIAAVPPPSAVIDLPKIDQAPPQNVSTQGRTSISQDQALRGC
jgi:hypothetical protein